MSPKRIAWIFMLALALTSCGRITSPGPEGTLGPGWSNQQGQRYPEPLTALLTYRGDIATVRVTFGRTQVAGSLNADWYAIATIGMEGGSYATSDTSTGVILSTESPYRTPGVYHNNTTGDYGTVKHADLTSVRMFGRAVLEMSFPISALGGGRPSSLRVDVRDQWNADITFAGAVPGARPTTPAGRMGE